LAAAAKPDSLTPEITAKENGDEISPIADF
jgi:hypothetical protein